MGWLEHNKPRLPHLLRSKGLSGEITDLRRDLTKTFNELATTKDTDIYVDDINGDDRNGGTSNKPVKTLVRAYALCPERVEHAVIIHLAIHGGSGYLLPTFAKTLRNNVWVVSEDFTELLTGTASSGGDEAINVSGASWVVDAYRGKTVEVLTGANTGDRRTIRNNLANKIQPVREFTFPIVAGDTFRIVEPVTHLVVGADAIAIGAGGFSYTKGTLVPGLYFENLVLDSTGNVKASASSVHFYGCEFTKDFLDLGGLTSWYSGVDKSEFEQTTYPPMTDRGTLNKESWFGWGCYHTGGGLGIDIGSFNGFWVGARWTSFGGRTEIQGGSFTAGNGLMAVLASAGANLTCVIRLNSYTTGLPILINATTGQGIFSRSKGAYIYLNGVDVTVTTGVGILAQRGGHVEIDFISKTSNITSSGVGLKAELGGSIQFEDGVTITATGNDTEVGNAPVVGTLASYGSAGAFLAESPSDGSVIQRLI